MAPLPPVASHIKVGLQWFTGADSTAMSNIYFAYTGSAPTAAQCLTMSASILASCASRFPSVMGTTAGMEGVSVLDLSSGSGAFGQTETPFSGSRTGGNLPAGAAFVLSHHIARRYRGGKPRTYAPWFTPTDLATSKEWLSASVTAGLAAWNGFITDCLAAGSGITISRYDNVSYYSGYTLGPASAGGFRKKIATPRATPVTDPILTTTGNIRVGSQRRRNRST